MLNPYEWEEYILLIGYTYVGDSTRIYGALSHCKSQEEVIQDLIGRAAGGAACVCNLIATRLTEDSFDALQATGRLPVIGE